MQLGIITDKVRQTSPSFEASSNSFTSTHTDFVVLASCSGISTDAQMHNTVILTAAQTGKTLDSLQHNQHWKRPAGATTSLAFGGKSRYLCIGDTSGAVCLWDLKKRVRVRQFFHDDHPSRQVSLDPTDTYILSLSQRLFSIYNLREGKRVSSIEPSGNYGFTRFHTSSLDSNITAVGTTEGSILLYDLSDYSSSDPLFTLNKRQSRITDLSFSPINPKLLGATSTDGSLMFYDKSSGEMIQQLASLSCGINSISMHDDGVSCAVGTETGEVLMYDLRQNSPLSSIYVEGSVKSLQFAPISKPKQGQLTVSARKQVEEVKKKGTDQATMQPLMGTDKTLSTQKPEAATNQPEISLVPKENSPAYGNKQTKSPKRLFGNQRPLPSGPLAVKQAQQTNNEDIREVVREEVEILRDDLEEAIRNLHMDMISQFHQQSQDLSNALTAQLATIDRLTGENQRLQEENKRLRELSQSRM